MNRERINVQSTSNIRSRDFAIELITKRTFQNDCTYYKNSSKVAFLISLGRSKYSKITMSLIWIWRPSVVHRMIAPVSSSYAKLGFKIILTSIIFLNLSIRVLCWLEIIFVISLDFVNKLIITF